MGVFTLGGINGNGNSNGNGIVMEWVGYPFVTAMAMSKANWGVSTYICIRMMPVPLLLMPPPV